MPELLTEVEVGCYVYAVLRVGDEVVGLQGLDDADVEYVEQGSLAAAVSRLVLDRPPGRRAELVAHSRVVDALAEAGPVVPVQFGSVLADRDSVLADLLVDGEQHFDALLTRLERLTQLNLRATYVEESVLAEVVAADPEIAELRRRTRGLPEGTLHPDLVRLGEAVAHALEQRRESDGDQLLQALAPLVAETRVRPGGGVDHVLDVALLVERERVAEVEQLLEDLAEAWHERIRLRLVGPVAPYDFVEGGGWA